MSVQSKRGHSTHTLIPKSAETKAVFSLQITCFKLANSSTAFTTVLGFINFSFIYFSPLPLPLYSNTHRGRQFYILTTSICSRSSTEIMTNMCLQSFLSLSVSFFTSLSLLNPKGQQLWKVNGEVSKIKSRKKIIFITEVEREGDISKG